MNLVAKTVRASSVALLLLFVVVPLSNSSTRKDYDGLFKNIKYRSIGPTRQGGRVVDFAVPSQQPYTFYAATASGGLWKTVNNGLTYEPIFDHQSVISIGAVAVAPSDPQIVWVGTGEANNSRSSYWGDGVYKSTDAGKTWTNTGLKESHHIGRIVVHPTNPDIVYVAALGHLYSENPERGLYKTTDGGHSWRKALEVSSHEKAIGVVDVAMDPRNPDVLYAAAYDKVRKPWTFNAGGPGSGIYKTTDGGDSWKKLENGLPNGMLGRIGLGIAGSNPDVIYATIENVNSPGVSDEERYQELVEGKPPRVEIEPDAVWRSDDAGESWRQVSPEGEHIGGRPPYYYGRIIADPNDENHLYVLSPGVSESTDGGQTWKRAFRFGGDNHALWIDPENSKHMLLGYDHGMGVTFDGGDNWYHPDNLPLAQFYAIGVDMDHPYNVYGGLQDNGSWRGPSSKRGGGPIYFEDWVRVGGGDGMYNVVDPSNNRYVYNESQFGPLSRLDQLTGERSSVRYTGTPDLRWNWNAPIVISPHDSNVVYHGANLLLRSSYRGESWEVISPDLTTNDAAKIRGTGNIQYCTITVIAESPVMPGVIWVGTDDGNVQLTRNVGKTWVKLNDKIPDNPGYWVSRVEASHHAAGTAYVTFTGYRRDDFRPFVYKTTDYGESWTSIAANLPDEPVNVIREDPRNPDLLFVGTDSAVYVSLDGGNSWTRMRNNMPTQPIHDLIVHPREHDLVVATHGRGIYITDISPLQQLTAQVLGSDVYLFEIETMVRWIANDRRGVSSQNSAGESEPNGVVINYYLSAAAGSEPKISIFSGARLINELTGPKEAGLNSALWDGTQRRPRTEEERKQYEEQAERRRRFAAAGFGGGRFGRRLDPDYIFTPAPEGEYTVVLTVDGKTLVRRARISKDYWYKVVE
ncbi:MAG: hypothetical protein ACE5HV_08475 [Acidobacteriota bacterium]